MVDSRKESTVLGWASNLLVRIRLNTFVQFYYKGQKMIESPSINCTWCNIDESFDLCHMMQHCKMFKGAREKFLSDMDYSINFELYLWNSNLDVLFNVAKFL